MPLPVAVIAAAVAISVVGVSMYFSADARTRRALKNVRASPISGLAPGQVARVRGRIVALGDLVSAPLSERECVYYLAFAEQQRSNGKSTSWREIAREERYVDFAIEDGTGVVTVRMAVPRVAVVRDVHTRSGTFDDANAREEAFLARHGLKSTGVLLGLNLALRYTEGALEVGEEVTVLGLVREETASGGRELVIDAREDAPLMLSDDPRIVRAD